MQGLRSRHSGSSVQDPPKPPTPQTRKPSDASSPVAAIRCECASAVRGSLPAPAINFPKPAKP